MASKKRTYSITDLDGATDMLRETAFKNYTDDPNDNINDYITKGQVVAVVRQYSLGKDDDGYFIIDDDSLEKISECISNMIVGVTLSKLASSGELDVYFDNEKNDFVFAKPSGVDK